VAEPSTKDSSTQWILAIAALVAALTQVGEFLLHMRVDLLFFGFQVLCGCMGVLCLKVLLIKGEIGCFWRGLSILGFIAFSFGFFWSGYEKLSGNL
jgi:hypothetical protein